MVNLIINSKIYSYKGTMSSLREHMSKYSLGPTWEIKGFNAPIGYCYGEKIPMAWGVPQ